MTSAQWDQRAAELDALAASRPGAYRLRVLAFVALGYTVILGSLVAVVAIVVGTVAAALTVGVLFTGVMVIGVKLLLPLLGVAGVLSRSLLTSLWMRIDPPGGITVDRAEAPALWREVDELSAAIGARVAGLHVISDLNAAAVSVPRFGIVGPSAGHVMIGLPLAAALSIEEFRAVLAHEIAHLSHRHGRFGAWTYRQRMMWGRLVTTMRHRRRPGHRLYTRFLAWYAPRFDVLTLAAARRHEYAADLAAANATSARSVADSLLSLERAAWYLETAYWPAVYGGVRDQEAPPQDPFIRLIHELPATLADPGFLPEGTAGAEHLRAFSAHPTTAERIAALPAQDAADERKSGRGQSAAAVLLGALASELAGRIDARWRDDIRESWRTEHREVCRARVELEALEATRAERDLTVEELRTRAGLTERCSGAQAAIAANRDVLAEQDDPLAHYDLGRLLLESGDEEGLDHLDAAIGLDAEATVPACSIAVAYLRRRNRADEAARWAERAESGASPAVARAS